MTEATMDDTAALTSGEIKLVKCECCKLTEECTEEYMARVREWYQGHWICGLCIEAVKDELERSEHQLTTEDALNRHSSFYEKFRSCTPTDEVIATVKDLLKRSFDLSSSSPIGNDGSATSQSRLRRSQSYFSSLYT
ncbi:putative Aldehyde dehydrogenase 7B4 [Heracleum sosnowskyi]|uniref:Aldehyde dehydrogenase 7B4 n=1 Tax=Heracleum sosnowskyi TaxID=360622 RepID=A0AAD8HKZ5_9APIA|nr:putative Aldehyde dehydrogenase 7B4 [Heracleum sosnowskyi]